MKKILFASTALVATAGVAAADIDFSGEANMGFKYDGSDWNAHTEATLTVSMTGETDGGLTFGAEFDITAGAGGVDEEVVYIEGGFGKFAMGEVGSAADAMLGLSDLGFDGLGVDNVAEYLIDRGDHGNMMYTGTFGDFKVGISHNHLNYTSPRGVTSIAATYTMGDYEVGLGYDNYDRAIDGSSIHLKLGADIADFAVDALYSRNKDRDTTAWGITAAYTMDAVTVTAAYSERTTGTFAHEAYGLGVAYDLGGGATLAAGVAEHNRGGVSNTVADLGITMKF